MHVRLSVCFTLLSALLQAGCGDDDDSGPDTPEGDAGIDASADAGSDAGADAGSPDSATVSGTITLAPDLFPPPSGDLAGPLLVAALDPATLNAGGAPAAIYAANVDLSEEGWTETYALEDIPPGTWVIAALFDKHGDFDFEAGPGPGDIMSSPVEVELSAGENRQDLVLSVSTPEPEHCGQAPFDPDERACVFDFVWEFANRNNMFLESKGIDWAAVQDQYRPLAEAAETDAEFSRVITEMVVELHDYHSSFVDQSLVDLLGFCPALRTVLVDGEAYVLDPEDNPDLAVGDRILSIDGVELAEVLTGWSRLYSRHHPARFDHQIGPVVPCGAAGTISLRIDRDDTTFDVDVERSEDIGERLAGLFGPNEGALEDADMLTHRAIELPDGGFVGYIRIETFTMGAQNMERLIDLADEAIDSYPDANALVFDVRGNGGGSVPASDAIIGRLVTEPTVAYEDIYPDPVGRQPVEIAPRGDSQFSGPVVVLIDEGSYSCATVFSAVLQGMGRATLVGRPTGGGMAAASLISFSLTDTSRLSMSASPVTDPADPADGFETEAAGAQPDVEVPLTVDDVLSGAAYAYGQEGDPGLAAALDLAAGL